MKLGITINDSLEQYINEIANLNNISKTTLCGIIVENFLSFNKRLKRKPIVKQVYLIQYEKEDGSTTPPSMEEIPTMTRKELQKKFEDEQYVDTELNDDELPF